MEIIYNLRSFNRLPIWDCGRIMHDNDDTPPGGATPIAVPSPLPVSIIFPVTLACGAGR
jgi:hypothetical protein